MCSLDGLGTAALIKRINALAEEAGAICAGQGLTLAPPESVMAAAEAAAVPSHVQARLKAIFLEIAAGKSILADRNQLPTKRR
jgi:hypothetical protein